MIRRLGVLVLAWLLAFPAAAQTVTVIGGGSPPIGAAGGDLTGTYPNPTVASIGGKAISLGGTFTTSGASALTLTTTAPTSVTLPTTGTLVNTAVTTLSSLASIGTIATGVWNGTVVTGQYGGTGVANTGSSITLGGNLTTSGAFATILTIAGATNVTLPTTGTLATLAGAEALTNKSLTATGNVQFADGAVWASTGLSDSATYSTTTTAFANISPTYNFTGTGNVGAFLISPSIQPGGASSSASRAFLMQPNLATSSSAVSEYSVFTSQVRNTAGFTGTLSNAYAINVLAPVINGSLPGFYSAVNISGSTVGNGITSGSVTNYGILIAPNTAAAGAGGTINNNGIQVSVPSSSSAGNTDKGIYITGNGGAASTKYALYSDSTAPSLLSGALTVSPANANVVFSPTGTGTVTINPATAGAMDNVVIGATTKAAGTFSTLALGDAATLSPTAGTLLIGRTATNSAVYAQFGNAGTSTATLKSGGAGQRADLVFATDQSGFNVSFAVGTGGVGVGVTVPTVALDVSGAGKFTGTVTGGGFITTSSNVNTNISPTGTSTVTLGPPAGQLIFANLSTGTNADFLCLSAGGVVLLQNAACTISSMRFKDMKGALKDSATAKLAKLRAELFTMKDQNANPDANARRLQIGLTAENVAAIEPRCAVYEEDGVTPKSYRQECLIALLVKANQESQARIARLEARGR